MKITVVVRKQYKEKKFYVIYMLTLFGSPYNPVNKLEMCLVRSGK